VTPSNQTYAVLHIEGVLFQYGFLVVSPGVP